MSASTSGQGPAAERFGPYIEELQEFFASSCLRYGTPEDILDLTERVDSSSAFAEDLSSMVRSIVLREGGALPHSQLLEIVALAIGGPRMDQAAQQFSQPLRYLLSFIGGVLRRAWNEPPGDSPRTAQHSSAEPVRHHQAEIVPFPVRPRVAGERFGSQAAGISAAADRAAHEGESGIRFGDTDERFGEVNSRFGTADSFAEEDFDPNERFIGTAETYAEQSDEDDLQSGEAPGPHIVRPTLTTASASDPSHDHLHHRRTVPDLVGEPTPAERSAFDPAIPAREAIEDPDLPGSEQEDEDLIPAAAASENAEGNSAAIDPASSPDFATPSWQRAAEAVRKGEVVPVIAPAVLPSSQPAAAASANSAPRPAAAYTAPASAFEPVRSQPSAPAFMQSTMRAPSNLNPEIPPPHILAPSFKPRLPRSPAGILVAGAAMLVVAGIVAASVNRTTELVGKQLPPSQSAPPTAAPAAATTAALSSTSATPAKTASGIQAASTAPAPRMRRVSSTDDDEDDLDVAPPYSTPVPGAPTISQELPPKPSPYLTQSAAAAETHSARPPSNEVASTGPIPAPPSASPSHELSQSYVGASPAAIHAYRDPDAAIVGDFRGTRPIIEPRIRNVDVSSGTMGGNLISAPTPDYPTLARLAHVSGEVVIQAVVGKGGSVLATHVLSGNHLLRGAAQDAVRRWRFKPYLMDGRPVEVSTIVTVRFKPHS